jgi:hypothetical protein
MIADSPQTMNDLAPCALCSMRCEALGIAEKCLQEPCPWVYSGDTGAPEDSNPEG